MANSSIHSILEKMNGNDKVYRYMATSDLFNELNKEGFKLDIDLELRLSNIVLQQLDDAVGDVSGLDVKWLVAKGRQIWSDTATTCHRHWSTIVIGVFGFFTSKHFVNLGEGGFGKVYKGRIKEKSGSKVNSNASIVDFKMLNSESMQGVGEWQDEVIFLGTLLHPNLVKLWGYCYEDEELLLVYEFMQRGSLENHFFGRRSTFQPLPWDIRLKIAIGAVRGLAFLHTSDEKVIYRDFKASNILLDGCINLCKDGHKPNVRAVKTRMRNSLS